MSRPRTYRVVAVWPAPAPDSRYEKTDRARVVALARKWAAAGATATVEQDVGSWRWRHVRTFEPPAPAVEEQPPSSSTRPSSTTRTTTNSTCTPDS